ncbi:MAG: NUDIX hydrolase [Sporichthyaceae bacterium]
MTGADPHRYAQPWELLAERPRTGGWVPVSTRTYRMPDGSVSDWDIHEPGFTTVAVLALTPDDRVVLTRQFRPGPGRVVFDLPGGIVDPGEQIIEAAARELREETGYSAASLQIAGATWAFGASTWRRHAAIARGCTLLGEASSWGGDEYCEPVLRSLAEFREILRTGETTEADVGYVALDAAGLL